MPAGYSKRSLVDKLGIKPNSRVAIIHPPPDYGRTLGPPPPGVKPLAKTASGLDFIQVCAVDEVWSGLKFTYRLKDRV